MNDFFREIIAFFEEENHVSSLLNEEEGQDVNHAFEISILYSRKSEIFKNELNAIFLSGNDIALTRVKKELVRINAKTNKIIGDDGFWEGGTMGELFKAKAFFTENLIQYIDLCLSPLQQKTNNKISYNDFDELFVDELKRNPELITECYQPLIDLEIINEKSQFIKPPKGNICVWYQCLKGKNLLHPITKNEDSIVTPLLNKKFLGLDLYIGAITEHHQRATVTHRKKFDKMLPNLPQKEKLP